MDIFYGLNIYLQHKILHFLNGYITVLNKLIIKLIINNIFYLLSQYGIINIINIYSIILDTKILLISILKFI